MRQHETRTGGHQEGNSQVDGARLVDQGAKMGMERVIPAGNERPVVRCAGDGSFGGRRCFQADMEMRLGLDEGDGGCHTVRFQKVLRRGNP